MAKIPPYASGKTGAGKITNGLPFGHNPYAIGFRTKKPGVESIEDLKKKTPKESREKDYNTYRKYNRLVRRINKTLRFHTLDSDDLDYKQLLNDSEFLNWLKSKTPLSIKLSDDILDILRLRCTDMTSAKLIYDLLIKSENHDLLSRINLSNCKIDVVLNLIHQSDFSTK